VIFHGGPADACRGFPGRTNIAAALALAAGEDAQVEVTIVGDPERTEHRHEIIASGSFGELRAVISFPADHPLDTVRIMSLSVLAELRRSAGDGEGGGSRSFHMTKRSA